MKIANKDLRNMICSGIAILSLMIAWGPKTLAGNRALFQLDGMDYLESELPPASRLALYEVEDEYYRKLEAIFDDVLFDSYLEEEAERLGKSKNKIRAERLSVAEPGEDDIRAFYDTIGNRIGKPYKAVRARIAEHLRQEKIDKKRADLLESYRQKNNFKILLPRITPPVIDIHSQGFPTKGDPKATVTIVEFADYQCPHCKTASEAIGRVLDEFKGKVRAIHMDYPINRSGISKLVAQGAACADQQGKFWPYHELAYQRQATLSRSSPIDLARDVGLDVKKFVHCFQSEEAKARVARGRDEALRLGLRSTPSIFVNGKQLIIHDLEKDLRQAVERELAYSRDPK
uniref:Thioredoxin n=1 Tax=Candidatus Kentrum sp. LFY TaxID=2126342 RepID=A0A450UBY7_9GAMM|nr:MAG: Thioredoxin [Candidatus Kentron sp. LFY]